MCRRLRFVWLIRGRALSLPDGPNERALANKMVAPAGPGGDAAASRLPLVGGAPGYRCGNGEQVDRHPQGACCPGKRNRDPHRFAAPAASEERIQTVTRARATVIGTAPTVTAAARTVELAAHDNTASGQNLAGIFALLDFYGVERRVAE